MCGGGAFIASTATRDDSRARRNVTVARQSSSLRARSFVRRCRDHGRVAAPDFLIVHPERDREFRKPRSRARARDRPTLRPKTRCRLSSRYIGVTGERSSEPSSIYSSPRCRRRDGRERDRERGILLALSRSSDHPSPLGISPGFHGTRFRGRDHCLISTWCPFVIWRPLSQLAAGPPFAGGSRLLAGRTAARPSSQVEVGRRRGVVRLGAGAAGRRGRAGPAAGPGRRQGRATGHVGAALRTTAATSAALLRRVGGRVPVAVVVRRVWNERERRLRWSRARRVRRGDFRYAAKKKTASVRTLRVQCIVDDT